MSTIAHLSDVHFGRHDPEIVAAVETFLFEKRPDLVVISGDFTQRARVEQYKIASDWLERLEGGGLVTLAVPGNHDVPLYDILRRFARPLNRYRRYIDDDLCPFVETGGFAVLGINTARSLTIKDGSVSREQIAMIRERFRDVNDAKTKILVTHHPLFAMPIGDEGALSKVVKRDEDALQAVADAGVDILLAGHFHRTYAQSAREMVKTAGAALVIQAGTATSTRLRGDELQSFNMIEIAPDRVELQVQRWDGSAFVGGRPTLFAHDGENWQFEGRREDEGTPAPVVAARADAVAQSE
ncbi:metallophosphoesterase family protein [Allosphingosinicella deserti]|uniref:Phosphohydrolase n=1 Tax=Allosphingosinicella deserti TaxID=2116704 RepID=A0A2P7QZY2_9SPHN|nr:metallophosphoesterase family protein [Sphingomonas deserti]PSJ43532.1 phosphohydrolase [Sphingomonas deserti]